MMNMKHLMKQGLFFATILGVAALVSGAGGCRSTKIISKAMAVRMDTTRQQMAAADSTAGKPPEDLRADSLRVIRQALSGLAANRIDFTTFSGRVKVSYVGGDGNGAEVTAYINIRKDSMIWV